jgi:hypothetical protein
MKKVYEETGKYLYDVSKIVLAIGGLTPFFKDGEFSSSVLVSAVILWGFGSYLHYKGENYGN